MKDWLDPDDYFLTWYDALLHEQATWFILWGLFGYLAYRGVRKFIKGSSV